MKTTTSVNVFLLCRVCTTPLLNLRWSKLQSVGPPRTNHRWNNLVSAFMAFQIQENNFSLNDTSFVDDERNENFHLLKSKTIS